MGSHPSAPQPTKEPERKHAAKARIDFFSSCAPLIANFRKFVQIMAFAAGFQSLDAAFSDQKSSAVSSSAPFQRKFWVKANSVAKGGTVFEFDLPNGNARIDATFKHEFKCNTWEMTTTASQPIGIKRYEGKIDAMFKTDGLPDEHIEIINGTFRRPIVNAPKEKEIPSAPSPSKNESAAKPSGN